MVMWGQAIGQRVISFHPIARPIALYFSLSHVWERVPKAGEGATAVRARMLFAFPFARGMARTRRFAVTMRSCQTIRPGRFLPPPALVCGLPFVVARWLGNSLAALK